MAGPDPRAYPMPGKPALAALALAVAWLAAAPSATAALPCVPPAESAAVTPAPAERFRCARWLAEQGRYAAALDVYEELSSDHPEDVDYLFGEAQARFWSGDPERALPLLERARELAPSYEDVWRLEAQVLGALESSAAAPRRQRFLMAARRRFPDADWLAREQRAPEVGAGHLRWETGVEVQTLDNGADDWRQLFARADWKPGDEAAAWLAVSEHRRFALADTDLAVGASFGWSGVWVLEASLQAVPDADFLPERVAGLGVSRALGEGWVAGLDARQRRYAEQTVESYGIEVERYFGRYRAAAQLQSTRLASASPLVYTATLNYYADTGSRYGLTLSAGDEVELLAPGQLLEMDVSALTLTGSHPLGRGYSILWRLGTHRQGSFYRRNAVGLSIAGEL